MQPRDLVASAEKLLENDRKGPPRQSDLKRALSAAYYAMLHSICWNCADSFIGKSRTLRSRPAWRQAYRAVEHGFAKSQCKNTSVMERFPQEIQDYANQFVLELDLKVEWPPRMWHFHADLHTRHGGPHGLERDHSGAL